MLSPKLIAIFTLMCNRMTEAYNAGETEAGILDTAYLPVRESGLDFYTANDLLKRACEYITELTGTQIVYMEF